MVEENKEHAEPPGKASEFERLRREAEGKDAKAQVALRHMLAEGGVEDDLQAAD